MAWLLCGRALRTVCVVVTVLGYLNVALASDNTVDGGDPSADGSGVALNWGIADTTATVGRVFRYHIPADAFKGKVETYQVVEAGKDTLPTWLHFAPDLQVLKGIPTPGDAGQLYLEVIARGYDQSNATDVFSVVISAESPTMSAGQPLKFKKSSASGKSPELVRCKREEPETMATIVIDADLDGLSGEQRLEIVSRFLSHMGLGEEMVKMVPAKARLLQDDTALVTGTGDATEPQHAGVAVSWLVGCGKVEAGHFPVLQMLDDDSGNGVMGRALGHPVAGWRVTNTRLQQQALKRKRRQVRPTPTPVVTISPPTGTAVDGEMTEADTMTHKVVDMASPTFTLKPTPTQPVMPKTTTPSMPETTPKMVKPDVIEPSKPPSTTSEATKTEALPTKKPSTPEDTKTTPMETTKKPMPPVVPSCEKPDVNEEIGKVTFIVGEIVNYRIPEETFDVCGKGGTSQTKLNLFKDASSKLPDDWFLKFDQKTQTLRGMPMKNDVGTYPMTLVAMLKKDPHGFITTTSFRISVRKAKGRKGKLNHEMAMTIDTDYDEFMSNIDHRMDLSKKVAGVFGDDNASSMTVTRIARGSVVYAFSNNSLAGSNCPVGRIEELADKLVSADGTLSPEAIEKLKPWVLTGASTAPAGDCRGNPDFPTRSATVAKPDTTPDTEPPKTMKPTDADDAMDKTDAPDVKDMDKDKDKKTSSMAPPPGNATGGVATAGKSSEDDIWINTVVPAVVIVAILLIALLIACVLYRKKRKGKMNLEDQNTFVNKGAPVIFPDELDEKPSDSSKPLLMEGSPPAPPPEYHGGRQPSESPEPAPHHHQYQHKESTPPTDEMDADIEDVTSPLYQPPPPVTASSGKQARPHVQQPYRSQPPEIHP